MSNVGRVLLVLAMGFWVQPAPAQVTDTVYQPLPQSSYVVFQGQINLPSEGTWDVRSASDEAILQLYRLRPSEVEQRQVGRRMQTALRERRIDRGQWRLRSLRWACLTYAQQHDGVGPATVQDLDAEKHRYVVENLQRSPWSDLKDADGKEYQGPFVFLVPQARFHFSDPGGRRIPTDRREVLAVELRPYVNDGQQWVMYTDGTCEREPIRQELVTAHGLQIRPIFQPADLEAVPPAEFVRYTLVAVRRDAERRAFDVVLLNPSTGQQLTHRWDPSAAKESENVLKTLATVRREAWQPYLRTGPAPVLRSWATSPSASGTERAAAGRQRPGNNLSMFALLGGRAAVEETLQLQVLRPSQQKDRAETVEVSSIKGVQVKAHPYEQLLAGQPGGQLQLAEAVPPDRFFVYVAKPEAILPFLDQGAGFLATSGAMLSGNRLDYDLTERYLQRLGVTRAQLEAVLRGGLVRDLAVVLPDLFLIDGTEMTVVARLAQPQLVSGLLQLLGAGGLLDTPMLAIKTSEGRSAYWALRGDLLCMSTGRGELQRVLQQVDDLGEGSLGRSAEFRYMLTQLPVTEQTRVYAYFSDPFVRRLVGPEVKLSQARRTRARARMEYLTAQMLRARLDGVSPASLQGLKQMEYLPKEFLTSGYSLTPQGEVQSDVYGSLARINTLPEVPLDRVTPAEAEAYELYVDEYSRYWREFFDPIAMRLSDTPEGSLELATFILPLVDSSVYNRLREAIMHAEDQRPLIVPQLDPSPILQFSVNLSDQSWQQIAKSFSDYFTRYAHVSPAVLDDLGPGLHLAVHDADPVIALGSGDLLGAFGTNVLRRRGNQMVMIPIMLSVLTRPCTVLIETKDAARTARFLRQAASSWRPPERMGFADFRVSFYQVDDRDAWVWTMDLEGLLKLRFGVEVIDRFLVLRNIPWSAGDRVVTVGQSAQNGAELTLTPAACRLQLPGLFATATDQERRAVMSGLGRLYPLMIGGSTDPATAAEEHQRLFGFRPVLPPEDHWVWQDFDLSSTIYGSPRRQRQPGFDPDRPFGLLHGVQQTQLSMQLEDAGLRSTIVWKFEP